jgi:hypothetical protein
MLQRYIAVAYDGFSFSRRFVPANEGFYCMHKKVAVGCLKCQHFWTFGHSPGVNITTMHVA